MTTRDRIAPRSPAVPGLAAILLGVLLMPLSNAQDVAPGKESTEPYRLEEDAWKRRPLLIFTPNDEHPEYRKQLGQLEGRREELVDRDMRLLILDAQGPDRAGDYLARDGKDAASRAEGEGDEEPPLDALAAERPITDAESRSLRKRFGVASDEFRVILVGKDTTEKSRLSVAVGPESVFDQIDAMPMRRREMRERRDPR